MKKKIWIIAPIGLIVTVLIFSALLSGALAQPPKVFTLKGQITTHETHSLSVITTEILRDVEKRSKGRLKFEIFYGGSLAPLREAPDALERGMFDFLYPGTVSPWYSGKDPRIELTGLPFVFKGVKDGFEFCKKPFIKEMLEKTANKFNVTNVGVGALIPMEHLLLKKKVTKMEDLKGLKIRAASAADMKALKNLGATPMSVVTTELYLALERGIIDGCALGYYTLEDYKLKELVKYIVECDFTQLLGAFNFNLDKWNKLPRDLQKLIRDVFAEWEPKTIEYWRENDLKHKKLAEKMGIEIISLSKEERASWVVKGGLPIWEDVAKMIGGAEGETFLRLLKGHAGIK